MTLIGAYCSTNWAGADSSLGAFSANIADVESHLGHKFAAQRIYRTWPKLDVSSTEKDAVANGRMPYVEIAPDGSAATWVSIAAGKNDAYIDAMGKLYKDWWTATGNTSPFYFVFQHEPDTETGMGTAADFQAAYRHWVTRWKALGVPCLYVFNLIAGTYNAGKAPAWYPGDGFCDLLGADGYNKGPAAGARWRSFSDIFTKAHAFAGLHNKPFYVGECGCAEHPTDVGAKAKFYTDAGVIAKTWAMPFITFTHHIAHKGTKTYDYRFSTSTQSAAAFAALLG